ncbi:division/cell wall cluster transcriptional repressor MraZ [Thermococcus gammatolerans]|uniref:Transcription regulator, putative n=1 Tax=Thermococcus gammatolerans (strain DSM 15229 / JCM 11827 / EJ3) TaxID=593117 RepID=C5A6M5_THEGJ|nr:AbrB family transcriptional regulator [Thermococcus gammatolerans]ACS33887.1 Transcription regulator, putative [Thermococcus gammatolerans EJ3]
MKVIIGKFDVQGRLLLPNELRDKLGDEVIIVDLEDRVELLPRKRVNLKRFFDTVEIEELKVWGELKKEL